VNAFNRFVEGDGRTAGRTDSKVLPAAVAIYLSKGERAMTKAQQVYERVEALVAAGARKAKAFRTVADELGQPFNSMRGAYYSHTRKMGGGKAAPRKKAVTTEDAIESALIVLNKAIDGIDGEIMDAKQRADEAKAEYDRLRSSADERKAAIQAKVDALSA
jgi:hypothetical protein